MLDGSKGGGGGANVSLKDRQPNGQSTLLTRFSPFTR